MNGRCSIRCVDTANSIRQISGEGLRQPLCSSPPLVALLSFRDPLFHPTYSPSFLLLPAIAVIPWDSVLILDASEQYSFSSSSPSELKLKFRNKNMNKLKRILNIYVYLLFSLPKKYKNFECTIVYKMFTFKSGMHINFVM